MRRLLGALFLLICSGQAVADTIITNVTVLPMNGGPAIKNATVITAYDRIALISTTPPETLDLTTSTKPERIDGTGKYLIPGLAEMHGHLPATGWEEARTKDTLFLYLAGGVTTVRGMLGDPVQFDLRDQIREGKLDGPTLYLAAPSLNGNSVGSPEQGAALVRQYHAEGWDLQKIHPGLTREEYDAIATTANDLGYPFGGHVPADVGVKHALASAQASIDHMDGYITWLKGNTHALSSIELQRAVGRTKASGVWIVPTQALFNMFRSGGDLEALMARPENRYMPKVTVNQWAATARQVSATANPVIAQNRQRLLKAFADAGVNIAMGSDAPQVFSVPGFSIWREIEVMRDAGLTNAQILDIGTAAAGRYLKDKDIFGVIDVGARADLILLDADPREDIMNITKQAGVMAAGRWYSREVIDARLADIAARHGN